MSAAVLLALTLALVVPPLLPLLALVDLARGGRFGLCRGAAVALLVSWCEAVALFAAFALWAAQAVGLRGPAYVIANSRLQALWCAVLFGAGRRLLGMGFAVEGDPIPVPNPTPGNGRPLLVFMRHVSTGDTLLPVVLLSYGRRWRPRYVLKRELLFDPCIDIVGQRLPNHFARRGSGDTEGEVAAVLGLYRDLGPHDAVVIFPEGTRFSPRRRLALIERLRERGPAELLALAEELQSTLPPLRAGALALLDENPGADLLVIGHTGLDRAASLGGLVRGATVGQTVRVLVRHVPFERIPATHEARAELLADLWREVDRFARAGTQS